MAQGTVRESRYHKPLNIGAQVVFSNLFINTYLKAGLNNHAVVVPNMAPPTTSLG